jgi:hypothetical protein
MSAALYVQHWRRAEAQLSRRREKIFLAALAHGMFSQFAIRSIPSICHAVGQAGLSCDG